NMGMLRGTFTLRQDDIFVIEASHGLEDSEKKLGRYQLGEGITGHVAATGIAQIIPNILDDSRFLYRTKSRPKTEPIAFLCVPIFHLGKVVGTLSIDRPSAELATLQADLQLLEIIGNISADAVAACIREHEEREELIRENQALRNMLKPHHNHEVNPGGMIGNCNTMQHIYALIRQVAPTEATVLIRGSSGTGKELVAKAIMDLGSRNDKPLLTLNCAALPENLVESELFGHEKGAFTGAVSRRVGRAEAADGGTLFLDEIGDLSLSTQVKLLRFIQEKTFSRIGSNEELKTNVRIIAATSRNLEKLMEEGKFREDLYYRLNIFPIVLPDLIKRRCDIILLAEHFITKHNLRYNKQIKRLSSPAVNLLMAYHWPGNVRELENCIERSILTAESDCIHAYNLPPSLQSAKDSNTSLINDSQASFETLVNSYERELLVEALKLHHGNMSAAGRDLQLSARVMHYKLNKLNIDSNLYKGSNREA
ncbi:MAG: sigma 54-interacting transcriptional regulator, partial [Lentisphaeria bacterium]